MDSNATVLTLLSIVVFTSGCLHSGGSSQTVTEGPESVMIQELNVNPTEIYSGQPVRASLTAVNAGNVEAEVMVGKNGGEILADYCTDMFELTDFSSSSTRKTGTLESYVLQPGEKVNARWTLEQKGTVPVYGKRCNLDFSVPFNYSVSTYRQLQIKQDREVSGSPSLSSESSSGPMVMVVEALTGSTGEPNTYVLSENGDRRINVMIQMINSEPSEEYKKGLIDVYKSSFHVEATSPLQLNESYENGEWTANGYSDSEHRCNMPDADIRMTQGRSIMINCEIPLDEEINSPSVITEISAGVDYTYVKNAGQVQVRVQRRG